MANWNKNAGYGASIVPMVREMGIGKVRIVGDSGTVNRQLISEIFNVDPDGEVRFFATIQAGVDA